MGKIIGAELKKMQDVKVGDEVVSLNTIIIHAREVIAPEYTMGAFGQASHHRACDEVIVLVRENE